MKSIEHNLVRHTRRVKCVARGSPCAVPQEYIKEHINQSYCLVQPSYSNSIRIEGAKSSDKVSVRMSDTSVYITVHTEALNTRKTIVRVTQKVVQMFVSMIIYHGQKTNRKHNDV